MSNASRGLGRGLDVLFSASANPQTTPENRNVPQDIVLSAIEPNPLQPRKRITEESLQELARSISQQGVLQPILLRPDPGNTGKYQIVAGERRWRAAALAEQSSIPAIVQEMTDAETLIVGLVENLQREDLNPIEEADAIEHLQQELNLSQESLAQKIGKSRPSIANSLRLLQLDPEIKEAVRNELLSAGAARTLLGITDGELRQRFFEHIISNKTPVRQIEQAVRYFKTHGRLPAHIDRERSARPSAPDPGPWFESIKRSFLTQMRKRLDCPIKISGDDRKGRITLSYRTEQELQSILEHFGVSSPSVSRETS